MTIELYIIIGTILVYLGGRDPVLAWMKFRAEGRSMIKATSEIIPMFILPWPRTVNKRLIWLGAGFFLIASGVQQFIVNIL